jgi:ribosomal protein L28
MSRTCEICGRGPVSSATRSHSNIKSKKWKYLNLQSKKIGNKTVKICTKCLKTQMKSKTA